MPLKKIDIGNTPNDGAGDTVRNAFDKVNANFDALADALMPRLLQYAAFAPLRHTHEELVPRHVRDTAPSEPPAQLGAIWIDTRTGKIYLATGTAQTSDWRELAFVGQEN